MKKPGMVLCGAIWLLISQQAYADDWCDPGELHPDAAPETQQFAFLLGVHDVTLHAWNGAGWTPPRPVNALWRGRYGMDGHAIVDEWVDPNPTAANIGINVRLYDRDEQVWKMMWIATSGKVVQDLRAEMRDGVMTMWQVQPPKPGWKAEFEIISDVQWARVSYQQDDKGAWHPLFRLVATRKPCASA